MTVRKMLASHAVRIRLALLCGAFAFVSGAMLLTVLYLRVDHAVSIQSIDVPVVTEQPGTTVRDREQQAVRIKAERAAAEQAIRSQLRDNTIDPLLTRGLTVVAGLTGAGLIAGWFAAGMTLRPLCRITETVRRIADRSLHERISLNRTRDEWWQLAEAVDAMLSRLDTAFAAQRQFVGNASHELKTPLAINRTLLEVAMNRPDAPAELLRLGETMMEVNIRHERLIDGLLVLARAEHRIADSRPVDLTEVIHAVLADLRPESGRLRLRITVEVVPVIVDGDPVLLDRLVQNLLQNAIRHNVTDGWLRVEAGPSGRVARLVVVNTGPMVPAASVPSLFEPFQRATNRVRSARGTGLGLSIVRSVAQAHGGTVTAAPRDGGGLRIEVTIPRGSLSH